MNGTRQIHNAFQWQQAIESELVRISIVEL